MAVYFIAQSGSSPIRIILAWLIKASSHLIQLRLVVRYSRLEGLSATPSRCLDLRRSPILDPTIDDTSDTKLFLEMQRQRNLEVIASAPKKTFWIDENRIEDIFRDEYCLPAWRGVMDVKLGSEKPVRADDVDVAQPSYMPSSQDNPPITSASFSGRAIDRVLALSNEAIDRFLATGGQVTITGNLVPSSSKAPKKHKKNKRKKFLKTPTTNLPPKEKSPTKEVPLPSSSKASSVSCSSPHLEAQLSPEQVKALLQAFGEDFMAYLKETAMQSDICEGIGDSMPVDPIEGNASSLLDKESDPEAMSSCWVNVTSSTRGKNPSKTDKLPSLRSKSLIPDDIEEEDREALESNLKPLFRNIFEAINLAACPQDLKILPIRFKNRIASVAALGADMSITIH